MNYCQQLVVCTENSPQVNLQAAEMWGWTPLVGNSDSNLNPFDK